MINPKNLVTHLEQWDLAHQRVLLRADLNVPLVDGTITNDYRLRALLPTIVTIQQRGGMCILATHIGRPQGEDPALSTSHLIPWFTSRGFTVDFVPDIAQVSQLTHTSNTLILLENLRFYHGEKSADHAFAQSLKNLADYYVNDAFGVIHRTDTSITVLPHLFEPERRSVGLLIQREIAMLNKLLISAQRPFVLILGGGKAADKLPLLQRFLTIADTIILCPAIVFTFLKALGKPVGASLVDTTSLELCKHIYHQAHEQGIEIITPVDYLVATKNFQGPLSYVTTDSFPADGIGISFGPKTAALIEPRIANAGTLFCNGLMGSLKRPETLEGAAALYKEIAQSSAFTVIGGGDSVAAVQQLGYGDGISYLSTGGGATLAYLSGQELPGLQAFIQ